MTEHSENIDLFAVTHEALSAHLNRHYGKGRHHATALYREVFKKGNLLFREASEFQHSPSLAEKLEPRLRFPACRLGQRQEDDVLKYAVQLADSCAVESVVIPSAHRTTLCVSSQVGCRMACAFCATGRMGFRRQLSTEEIVWQVWAARFLLRQPIQNVVFMGMGEPFDNWPAVHGALRVISDPRGLDIAPRHITLSTAGHAEGIETLSRAGLPNLRLAVSLHAADDDLRTRLMPLNRKYPLERLRTALHKVPLGRQGVFFFEYVLLAGVNDSNRHADQLADYLEGLPARINIIPYNADDDPPFETPSPETIERFCKRLYDRRLFVRLRASHGDRIRAACGQLIIRPGHPLSQSDDPLEIAAQQFSRNP